MNLPPRVLSVAILAAGLSAQPLLCQADAFGYTPGGANSPVTGAAGTQGSTGEAQSLEKCARPMGAIAVVEPQDYVQRTLSQYNLPSPTSLIRLMIHQSNCFMVVERGTGMRNMMQERALAESGNARAGSNIGKGQMVAADFILTPEVVFSQNNAGGVGAALGGIFGAGGHLAGAIVGGLKFKQAQTSMLVADARSGLQVAAATGSAEKTDFALGGLLGGGGGFGGLGAYENTAEGKVVAASFLDNYNKIVQVIRNSPELQRTSANLRQEASKVTTAGAVMEAGDVVVPKIGGVKVTSEPGRGKVVATMKKGNEAVVTENGGDNLKVQGDGFEGWVAKAMVKKQ
ncbi:MAG: CsgG/HfaB family protein [Rhodocyclaceae bacterium]|nr:CsgG/HfaB family protein [Rhodocyclaceae bacterium]